MAFARFGGSDIPLQNFGLSEPDTRPRGTNKARIVPLPTLVVQNDGSVQESTPRSDKGRHLDSITFKDVSGFRPVAPFFEVWGATKADESLHLLTVAELEAAGFILGDVKWTLKVGNAKAYHCTLMDDDYFSCT